MAKKRRTTTRRTATGKQVNASGAASFQSLPEPFLLLGYEQRLNDDSLDVVTAAGTGGLHFTRRGEGGVRGGPAGYHFQEKAELIAAFEPRNVTHAVVDFEITPAARSDYAYPLILSMRPESRMQVSFNDRLYAVNGPAGSRVTQLMNSSAEAETSRQRLLAVFDLSGDWVPGGALMTCLAENFGDTQVATAADDRTPEPAMLSEIILGRGGNVILHRAEVHLFSEKPSLDPQEFLTRLANRRSAPA